jgi:hypothetical protein
MWSLVAAVVAMTATLSFAANQDFSWTWGTNVTQSQFPGIDEQFGIVKDGTDLWLLAACGDGGSIRRYKGTDMDNLVPDQGASLKSWPKPHGDDGYWLCGNIWVDPDDGGWYAAVHVEFNYQLNPWPQREIVMAKSTDKGLAWTNCGVIWKSDSPLKASEYPGDRVDCGIGDQHLFIDRKNGYAYIFAQHYNVLKTDKGDRQHKGVVARCALKDKLRPGKWKEWYDGGWNSDCLGGKHSFLFDGACGAPFYNSYLGKYVYVHYRLLGPNKSEFGITTCTDMSLQNWDTPVKFHDYAGGVQWYGMVVDDSLDNNIVGRTFRFYSASNDVEEKDKVQCDDI